MHRQLQVTLKGLLGAAFAWLYDGLIGHRTIRWGQQGRGGGGGAACSMLELLQVTLHGGVMLCTPCSLATLHLCVGACVG
jgi:hypothetical protein